MEINFNSIADKLDAMNIKTKVNYEPVKLTDVLDIIDKQLSNTKEKPNNDIWDIAWQDNLLKFNKTSFIESLIPNYINYNYCRYNNGYITSNTHNLELEFYTTIKQIIFERFLKDVEQVIEFGCGTGYNLIHINNLLPDKQLYGADWSQSSMAIFDKISSIYSNIKFLPFNMLEDTKINIEQKLKTAILTLHSMEQLGENFECFFNTILDYNASIYIHIEPILELYNTKYISDRLAIEYHNKKRYLKGYLPHLTQHPKVKILNVLRTGFGSLFHEGYSIIVWTKI